MDRALHRGATAEAPFIVENYIDPSRFLSLDASEYDWMLSVQGRAG